MNYTKTLKNIGIIFAICIFVALYLFFRDDGMHPVILLSETSVQALPTTVSRTTPDNPINMNTSKAGESTNPVSDKPSPNITQPITLWPTRIFEFHGKRLTYEFGKGNPAEVSLTGRALKDYWRRNGKGYMTPQAEIAMKAFLDNPSLPYFINKCYKQFNWYNEGEIPSGSLFPHKLNLEDLMYIDSETGRKEFQYDRIGVIAGMFTSMDFKLDDISKRRWTQCLSNTEYNQHFLPLQEQFFWVWKYYGNQWEENPTQLR